MENHFNQTKVDRRAFGEKPDLETNPKKRPRTDISEDDISNTNHDLPPPPRKSRPKAKKVPQKSPGRFRGASPRPRSRGASPQPGPTRGASPQPGSSRGASPQPGPSKKRRTGDDHIGPNISGAISRDVSPKRTRQGRNIRDSPSKHPERPRRHISPPPMSPHTAAEHALKHNCKDGSKQNWRDLHLKGELPKPNKDAGNLLTSNDWLMGLFHRGGQISLFES